MDKTQIIVDEKGVKQVQITPAPITKVVQPPVQTVPLEQYVGNLTKQVEQIQMTIAAVNDGSFLKNTQARLEALQAQLETVQSKAVEVQPVLEKIIPVV